MDNTINGRTPEEIKKGLECCSKLKTNCSLCSYSLQNDGNCMNALVPDSIALIRQLERERDAAVEDLETMGEDRAYCGTCLHYNSNHKEEPCSSCMSGYLINNWQWRGVQEVE